VCAEIGVRGADPMEGIGELKWRSAVVEGFAVLVGILLAFTIDAWWDQRSQQAEAQCTITHN